MAFAKIIESENFGQVLLTNREDDGTFELNHTFELEGVYVDLKITLSNQDRAEQYFEDFDEDIADELITSQLKSLF